MSAPVLSWLLTAQGKPRKAFLARQFSPCANPLSTVKASSSFCSARTSEQGPPYPTLRANPFPEVTDLFCRLPLPTLFYRLEAVHLGDLLRIWVRSGAKITHSPEDFQGPTPVHRTPREARSFTATTSLSPAKPIPGSARLTKKRELFPGLGPTSPRSFALPHSPPRGQSPRPGSGILTRFPFDRCGRCN